MRGSLLVATITAAAFALAGSAPAGAVALPGRAAPGSQLWGARFPAGGLEQEAALVVSPHGGTVFVTGTSDGRRTGTDFATVAYSAGTGRQLWVSRYAGQVSGFDGANALAVSSDGATVFVTGNVQVRNSSDGYETIAYSVATGRQLWASRYIGSGKGFGAALAVAVSQAGGAVFVTGDSQGSTTGHDYATVAYSAATGKQLWASRYSGYLNRFDTATAVAVNPAGTEVFVTGTSTGRTISGYATVAYSAATGKQLWARRYHGFQANSVAVSPDGNTVYVTGTGSGSGGPISGYATVAYSAATGRQLWASRYLVKGNVSGGAFTVALSPAGTTVYVTGNIENHTTDAYATVAYRG